MTTDRITTAKKLLGALIIVSYFLVIIAYGGEVSSKSPSAPLQGGMVPSVGVAVSDTASDDIPRSMGSENTLGGNPEIINYGNGATGSSRPSRTGEVNESGAANAEEIGTGNPENTSPSVSLSNQVIVTPTAFPGISVTSTGTTQKITIDTRMLQEANETVAIQGDTIIITKGPVTLTTTTAAPPNEENHTVTAVIKSITMNYAPVTAQFADTGPISSSFTTHLMCMPPENAMINVNIVKKPDSFVQDSYDSAVQKTGNLIDATAYTLKVAKTNLNDGKEIGSATVSMSVSPSWVTAHGGADKIKILRYADTGTSQVLDTYSAGLDSSGNMIFTGTSPDGLSIFALGAVSTPAVMGPNTMLFIPPIVVFGLIMIIRRRQ